MAPKKGQQTKQPQQQSQPPVVSAASARGASSPSVPPSSSTTPSEALVLVVASPACQWRSLGSSSLRPHQASMLSSAAARTQEEQLSALMVDSNRQHSERTLEQREEQKRTNDDGKDVCEEENREDKGNTQKRGCINRYGLSRFGRSFLATQTFTRVEVQVTSCSTTKTKEISSDRRKTADLEENACITTYVCAATNPFGGVKGLLPLVLLPESFIDQFCYDGRKELYLTIWGNPSSSSSPSSLSRRQTNDLPKLLLNVLNAFDVPPSTAALSKFDGLVFVMAPPPSPKEKVSYQRSAQCDIPFRLEVTTVETARVDKESVSADTQTNPPKASTVSSPHQQMPKVTLRLTANPMKPAMCAAISNADVSGVKVDATVQLVLKRENCAATCSAPMRAEDLFAVKAIASGIVSSSAETAVSSTSTAAVHPNKMGGGTNARSKQLTISDGGAKGTSTCLLHPLIAKERVRAKLREAIEATATTAAYASPPILTLSSSAPHEPSSYLVSASGEAPSIDLETITAMLNECIPDDVLGTSARSTITNVLSRVLMCCLQSERFNTLGLSLPKGVLLYDGPLPFGKYKPTGKTFMMSAMARTIENLRKYTDHHHHQNETFKPTVSGDSNEEVEKDKNSVAQQQQQRSGNKKTHPSLATLLYTMVVDGHSCLTKEVGGTEKNIAKMLRDARVLGRNQAATMTASVDGQATSKLGHHGKELERATTIIFLDNLEVLAPPRQDASSGPSGNSVTDRSLSTLLTELDGVRGTSPDMNNVILIATCRGSLASVDAAVRRPGRLDLHIELNPPQADVCSAAIAAPLLPIWQGIQLFREKQRRAKHQADSTVVEEDANNGNNNNQEPSTAAQTQSIISVVDNNSVAVGGNEDKGFGFGTASSAVISLAHAEFLAAVGFGDLWLRLSGSDFVVPSSVADARYVSRQVLFSMVSRLTSQFPAVNFIPSAGESGSESTSALSDWVCRLCQAMDASTMDIGSTPSSFPPLLSSCVDAADRMKVILKDEIARAMKSLSS